MSWQMPGLVYGECKWNSATHEGVCIAYGKSSCNVPLLSMSRRNGRRQDLSCSPLRAVPY